MIKDIMIQEKVNKYKKVRYMINSGELEGMNNEFSNKNLYFCSWMCFNFASMCVFDCCLYKVGEYRKNKFFSADWIVQRARRQEYLPCVASFFLLI